MKQRIYDSRTQNIIPVEPCETGKINMYVCGPTVQSAPHIGHLRSALVYDQMRRWFQATGNKVTLIRNVTDIDDKILENARILEHSDTPEQWWALAYRVERLFTAAYDAIGVLPPTYEPRATANVHEMIALIQRLIERGHAYQAQDHSANVYFDTASWPAYGELTRQRRDQLEETSQVADLTKRDPQDFALWKAYRDTEPLSASWPSPWGRGRPGWHIECSAMATRYLGEEFDIHGGGLDLRFPHHENELAQSAAAGHPFARYWVHNGLVNTGGQKMSKSLGNSLFAADLLAATRPIVLRYFLGSAHYRSVLEYTETSLSEAEAAFSRIESFLDRSFQVFGLQTFETVRAADIQGSLPDTANQQSHTHLSGRVPAGFAEAMFDDFAIPQALAVLHGTVREGNSALDASDREVTAARFHEVTAMLSVLGLNPVDEVWNAGAGESELSSRALEMLVTDLIGQRAIARKTRDFATSDQIRDRLQAAGITLEDTSELTRWSLT